MAKTLETLERDFDAAVKAADRAYAQWDRAKRAGAPEPKLARLWARIEAKEAAVQAVQAEKAKLEVTDRECPCCTRAQTVAEINARPHGIAGLGKCDHCGAVYGTCSLGDSYRIALPQWHEGPEEIEDTFYFDIMALGSEGIKRRHGWVHKITRRITQTG